MAGRLRESTDVGLRLLPWILTRAATDRSYSIPPTVIAVAALSLGYIDMSIVFARQYREVA
jgi:hypothetical protein